MSEQTARLARQAKQARIVELAKTAKLFPAPPEAIAWVVDHRLPEIDAKAIFLANDIEPEGQWAVIEALQKAEAKAADHAKELGAAIARRVAEEEPYQIKKRRVTDEPKPEKEKWDLATELEAAEAKKKEKREKQAKLEEQEELAAEGKIFSTATQPAEESEAGAQPEGPEPEGRWIIPHLATSPVLVRKAPMDNAKLFARDMLTYYASGAGGIDPHGAPPTLGTYFFRKQWWQWNGSAYEPTADDQRIWDMASNYLNDAKVRSGEDGLERFRPETKQVNEMLKFLRTCVGIDERDEPPRWLDSRNGPDPAELLAFRNCLVNVRTGETYGHDPRLWVHDGLDFDYRDGAQCPRWQWFLEDIHPGDGDAQSAIEEWLGYGMTWDNRFEKIALWVGEPRSGRGTIAAIQELLVGPRHHVPLDIHTWNSNENSKQDMIGKKVGIFHDVRLKEAKQYGAVGFDPGGLDVKSIQALLEFSSGDAAAIKVKFGRAVIGRPKIKLTVLTNKILNLRDDVLLTRLFLLYFGQSRLGKEDKELKLRVLPSEISGIAWRCLAAYRRLLARDAMLAPASGLAQWREMKERQNHWLKFMNRYWRPATEAGQGVRVKVFLAVFRYWAREEGRIDLINTDPGALIAGVRGIKEWQWLEWTRHNSDERQYPVVFREGVVTQEMADAIKVTVDGVKVRAAELLAAVGR